MDLAFILTARCNAACGHCSKAYGPTRTELAEASRIFRLIDAAVALEAGQPSYIAITGGEPFLEFALLVKVVRHAARAGADVGCVTNAYWARTDEIAEQKLALLKDAGLTALAVSVSGFHQQFVALQRARRALDTARRLGLETELKGAVTNADLLENGALTQWQRSLRADRINIFAVLPYLRDGAHVPEREYHRAPGLPQEKCPGEIVTVDFNGMAKSCCSPGYADDFLSLGDTDSLSMSEINERFRNATRQRILREIGPIHFACTAIAAGAGHLLREAYAGPCDLCLHIRNDSELRRIAENATHPADGHA